MKHSLRLCLLLAVLLWTATSAIAKNPPPPDYFPAPLGAEWHYDVKPDNNPTTKLRNVVTKVSPIDKGQEIEISSFAPMESKSLYHKLAGMVYLCKVDTPSANYVLDYEADKPDLMNPLAIGKDWKYAGKGGGMDITQDWKVVGSESVQVPAGKYNAIKVVSNSTMAGTAIKYTFWYVDQVGGVKTVTEANNAKTVVELTKVVWPKK